MMDCGLTDECLRGLAEYLARGWFTTALEELDFSFCYRSATPPTTFRPAGLHVFVQALNARGEGLRLKRLKLGGHVVGNDGVVELLACWREGVGFAALEVLFGAAGVRESNVETLKELGGFVCARVGENLVFTKPGAGVV